MSPRRAALLALAALALGAGAWLALSRAGAPSPGDPASGASPAGRTDGAPAGATTTEPAGTPRLAPASSSAAAPAHGSDAWRGRSVLTGVVRRDGKPAAASVEVRWSGPYDPDALVEKEPALVAAVRSGDDGRFRVEGLGALFFLVEAVGADGARESVGSSIPADGAHVAVVLHLRPVSSLSGRVVHADGRPWSGEVAAHEVDLAGWTWGVPTSLPFPLARTRTDAQGAFRFTGLPRGEVVVAALDLPRGFTSSPRVEVPREGDVVLVVGGGTAWSGRVVADADGTPVADAAVTVAARAHEGNDVLLRLRTDAAGEFRPVVPDGARLEVGVSAPGFAATTLRREPGSASRRLEARLHRPARIRGRVLRDADGSPVEGATVSVDPLDVLDAVTDSTGAYVLEGLEPGAYSVRAAASGLLMPAESRFRRSYSDSAVRVGAGATAEHDVRMIAAARIVGRVLDPDGKPAAGAVVSAPFESLSFHQGNEARPAAPVACDAEGRFSLEGLTPGASYALRAALPDAIEAEGTPAVASVESPPVVRLQLGAARRLRVTVLDEADGAPIAEAYVSQGTAELKWFESYASTTTASDGTADLGPVPRDDVPLRVVSQAHLPSEEVTVSASQTEVVVRLRRGARVVGRVLRPDGTPAAGAHVAATSTVGPAGRNASSAADGTFVLRGLPSGRLHLRATDSVGETSLVAVAQAEAGAEGVVLTLAPDVADGAGRVTVSIFDDTGAPVPRAWIEARREASSLSTEVTGGRWVHWEGWQSVRVFHARDEDGRLLPLGPAEWTAEPGGAAGEEIVLRMPRERAIRGVVRDDSGALVASARVTARRPGGDRGEDWWGASLTGVDGAFRLGGLGAGAHELVVEVPPGYVPIEPISVEAGREGVAVVLTRGVAVKIVVLDAKGAPLRGADVNVERRADGLSREPFARGTADGTGAVRLDGLPRDEDLLLRVRPPYERKDVVERVVRPWRARDETFRLERGWRPRGVVVDGEGRPVAAARVTRLGLPGEPGPWDDTSAEGRFELDVVPWAPTRLRVNLGGDQEDDDARVLTVEPTEGDLSLRVDGGRTLEVRLDGWGEGRVSVTVVVDGDPWRYVDRLPSTDPRRVVTFRGLRGDVRFAVFAQGGDGVGSALRTGVLAGGEPVRLSPVRGKTSRVRVRGLPAGKSVQVVLLRGGLQVNARDVGGGEFEAKDLPDGPWTVSAFGEGVTGEAQVLAGGTAEVTLVPDEDDGDDER